MVTSGTTFQNCTNTKILRNFRHELDLDPNIRIAQTQKNLKYFPTNSPRNQISEFHKHKNFAENADWLYPGLNFRITQTQKFLSWARFGPKYQNYTNTKKISNIFPRILLGIKFQNYTNTIIWNNFVATYIRPIFRNYAITEILKLSSTKSILNQVSELHKHKKFSKYFTKNLPWTKFQNYTNTIFLKKSWPTSKTIFLNYTNTKVLKKLREDDSTPMTKSQFLNMDKIL